MASNRDEILSVLTDDWQTTADIASKLPAHGRMSRTMVTMSYTVLRRLAGEGAAEKSRDARGNALWRRSA